MTCFLKNRLYKLSTFAKTFDTVTFLKNIFSVLIITLIVLTSGYSGTEFFFTNRFVAVLYVSLFLCSLILFLFNLPFRRIKLFNLKKAIKNNANYKNVALVILGVLFLVAIFATSFKDNNFNGAIRFTLILLSSVLIVTTVPFKKFCKLFCWTMFFVCLVTLVVYLVSFIVGVSGATSFTTTEKGTTVLSFGWFSFFLTNYYSSNLILTRLCGPFWEPSIFAAMLIIALFLLILSDLRNKLPFYLIFLVSLFLTYSTGGILMLIFVLLMVLSEKLYNPRNRIITVSLIAGAFIGLAFLAFGPLLPSLTKRFPTVFGKLENGVFSNIRFHSLSFLFKAFLQSPIFGSGLHGARIRYLSMYNSTLETSITSTTGMLLASFGIIGGIIALLSLVIPVLNEKYNNTTLIVLFFGVFVLINLENMIMVSVVILFIAYLNKEALYGEKCLITVYREEPKVFDYLIGKTESGKTNKNLFGLLVIKGLSLIIALFAIPVYNTYFITNEAYGIWSVIISILTWTLLLDFGFGSGMRIKLADAIENNDKEAQKKIVSSTYIGSILASILVFVIFEALILSLNLNSLLNISNSVVDALALKISMSILAFGLCLEFVLKNITFINYAEKRSIQGSSYALVSSILLVLLFVIFTNGFNGNKLLAASIMYVVAVNIPFIIGTISYFFKERNRHMLPSIKNFEFKTCKTVMSYGIMFFLIQIGFMLIVRTDSLFISAFYSPTSAGDYSKYYRIFSFFIGLMGAVVQQPIWSAIASSINKGKPENLKKYSLITLGISILLFIFCVFAGLALQFIFDVWLGDNTIKVEMFIVVSFIIYSFVILVTDALTIISNGLKIILPQLIFSLVGGAIKIGLVLVMPHIPWLINAGWGVLLIIDAICYLPLAIILFIAIYKKIKSHVMERRAYEISSD